MDVTEVARSFSRKMNLGGYENIDLFCSMKANVGEGEDPGEISIALHEMCKADVMRDAKAIKNKLRGQNG
jgi:hypothetical protein